MASKKTKRRKVAAAKAASVSREQNSKKAKAAPPGASVLHACPCPAPAQDVWYGKGIRVHNVGNTRITCTACSAQRVRSASESAAA